MKNSGAIRDWHSFWRFPIVWLIVGALGIVLADAVFRPLAERAEGMVSLIWTLIDGLVVVLIYKLTIRYLARRSVPELAKHRAGIETVMGMLIGTIFIVVSTFIIVAMGGYSLQWVTNVDTNAALISSIGAALGGAIVEELIFRGLLFQALHRWGGDWLALAVTSLFFGVAHLGNPGATLWSGFAIAVEAGVLLGAAYMWRRNLWFTIGLHFAWNALESLLGILVSGHAAAGLFTVKMKGAALLTGGNFGLEGSIVPVLISLLISVPMLIGVARNRDGHLSISRLE
ncbi:CPBP family intramembrane glutamic endopeptidase [Paenibacillus segetis]|nr:type II CAAX endopeptidase family protein [Paenibacillus segetis]